MNIENIYARLRQERLDGLLVSSAFNISYLTDYTSRDSFLLVSKKRNIYITDSRYTQEAKASLKGNFAVRQINGSIFKVIAEASAGLKLKRVGFEESCLSFGEYKKIKASLGKKINFLPTRNIIEELRQLKSPDEIRKIKKAISITLNALSYIENFIRPGRSELEIAAELQHFISYNGADRAAFDTIVASGPNSSFAHHLTSNRKAKDNEHVLVDIGVNYRGYKSDLTRVFFLGKISPLQKKIYDIVFAAQQRAIKKIKPAVNICAVDTAARQYIAQSGYGRFFGHSLGHGVGLEVHEPPSISSKEKNKLMPGMVFTVEPAIYLPHKFGIRVEDMVLVTEKRAEVLSGIFTK